MSTRVISNIKFESSLDLNFLWFYVLDTYTGGNVGLIITQAMSLTGSLQWGIRQSAEFENQMTSIERVLEYTNIPKEAALESPPGKYKKFDQISTFIIYYYYHNCILYNYPLPIHTRI